MTCAVHNGESLTLGLGIAPTTTIAQDGTDAQEKCDIVLESSSVTLLTVKLAATALRRLNFEYRRFDD